MQESFSLTDTAASASAILLQLMQESRTRELQRRFICAAEQALMKGISLLLQKENQQIKMYCDTPYAQHTL
jgi:hypothetical protein